jgi:hypothetical protein
LEDNILKAHPICPVEKKAPAPIPRLYRKIFAPLLSDRLYMGLTVSVFHLHNMSLQILCRSIRPRYARRL